MRFKAAGVCFPAARRGIDTCSGWQVNATDTNGAGDTFATAYMLALSRGSTDPGAVANWAASRAVMLPQSCKPGCITSAIRDATLWSQLRAASSLRCDLPYFLSAHLPQTPVDCGALLIAWVLSMSSSGPGSLNAQARPALLSVCSSAPESLGLWRIAHCLGFEHASLWSVQPVASGAACPAFCLLICSRVPWPVEHCSLLGF